MKISGYYALGVLVMVGICFLAMTAVVAGSIDQGNSAMPLSEGAASGIKTESTHTMGKITYYVANGTGVYKSTLDASNTIYIRPYESLYLQVPAKVSGPSSQRGVVTVGYPAMALVTHALLLKPGKQGTLTTYPPFRFTSATTATLGVYIWAPDGGFTDRPIIVVVS